LPFLYAGPPADPPQHLVFLTAPKQALDQAGAKTMIVSPAQGEVQGWNHFHKADKFKVDVPLEQADAQQFDALLLPGGVANPHQLRMQPKAVELVRSRRTASRWR
jgi:protease I